MLRDILKRKKPTTDSKSTGSSSNTHWCDGLYSPSEALPLEPRIMLDGAASATLAEVSDPSIDDEKSSNESAELPIALQVNQEVQVAKRHELVIVDTTLDGYEQLLADLVAETDQLFWQQSASGIDTIVVDQGDRLVSIYAIDTGDDVLQSITSVMDAQTKVDALHVLSHGTTEGVLFDGVVVNAETLNSHSQMVEEWSTALSAEADILLYGCETGAEGLGVAFVQQLSTLTGADVAASNDLTGSSVGADWELEVSSGPIETQLVTEVMAQSAFAGTLSADATTTLDVPGAGFINESVEFSVTVDNTGTDTGYEPYLSVFIAPGFEANDVTLLGASLPYVEYTWDAAGGNWLTSAGDPLTEHPLNSALALPSSALQDGTQWFLVDLPFGSFVTTQPPAEVTFSGDLDPASGAVLGEPIDIQAQSGFALGEDPVNNPLTDPPSAGPMTSASITPSVIEVDKQSENAGDNAVGIESEIATGPNSPITYEVIIDIANGQTVDNILLTDLVPNNVHYLGSLSVGGSGTLVNIGTTDATIGVHNGNQISVSFDSVTGTASDDDVIITYQGYIPELDADGNPILDPLNGGAPVNAENTVQVDGIYQSTPVTGAAIDEIAPRSLAIQKSVAILDSAGSTVARDTILPGDILEWTLKYQVSDYFSLENFEVVDTFSDGQLYIPGSATAEIFENGSSTGPSPIAAADTLLRTINPATGNTQVVYDMSGVIADQVAGSGGELDGDLVDGVLSAKTAVHIKFQTEVQEYFQFPDVFGGDASIDVGDILSNSVFVTAEVEGTGNQLIDSSAVEVSVDTPEATKSIYAINLDTDNWDPADPEIAPGQSITYRITVTLPTADVENLTVTDYLPLPIFAAASNYDYSGFYTGVDNVPAPGEYGFGPLTNAVDFPAGFFNTTGSSLNSASVVVDAAANSVTWDFDAFDQMNSAGAVIDLLFTTSTANVPFDDGLSLTNQAQVSYDNTNNPQEPLAALINIEPLAPVLGLSKGVVAVDAASSGTFTPAAVGPVIFNDAGTAGPAFTGSINSVNIDSTPIDSNVAELDAGDLVRYAITIENTGGFAATNVTVNDQFPSELAIPAGGINMTAALGDGAPLTVAGNLFNATGAPDSIGVSFYQGATELYLGAGRVDATEVTDGSNIIVLTYDLVVDSSATPLETIENVASLLTYAAVDGGVDYTAGENDASWTDNATVDTETHSIDKSLTSSGIDNSTNPINRVVAGEYITYTVVITIPEGTIPAARVQDHIDADVRFDELISITPSSPSISTDLAGGFAGVTAPASGAAGVLRLDLGNVTNTNSDNTVDETIELVYRVYARGDAPDNVLIRNRAYLFWDTTGNGNPNGNSVTDRAPNLRVFTPFLQVQKEIVGPPPLDQGDPITYRITVDHAANSDTTAFNVDFSDTLPPEIGVISIDSVVDNSGAPVGGFTLSGNTISNPDFDLPKTDSVTITVSGTVISAFAGNTIENTANIEWTTLDPSDPDDGVDAVEPTLTASGAVDFVVTNPTIQKTIVNTGINSATNNNTQVVNGEYVTYRLELGIPEGAIPQASVIDTLPAGVTYDPSFIPTISLNNGNFSHSTPWGPPVINGSDLIFNLGTIQNNSSINDSVPEVITIEYRAYVEGVVSADVLTNSASFIWDIDNDGSNTGPGDGSQSDTSSLVAIEPKLEIIKNVTPALADAGDVVEYTIQIQHTAASETDAFDAVFSDVFPSEVIALSLDSVVDSSGSPVSGFSLVGNALENSDYDLMLGDTITIKVSGVLDVQASASTEIDNIATISWDTLGEAGHGNQLVELTDSDFDTATVLIASPTFSKNIVSSGIEDGSNATASVVAGEFVTHELVVVVPEGVTPLAEVIDYLDEDLILDPSFTVTAVGSSGVSFTGTPAMPTLSGNVITFELGTITNTNTDNSVDESITITYRVYADNDVVRADNLQNNAEFSWDSDNDGLLEATDSSLGDGTTVEVIAPELQIEKTITTVPLDAGDVVVYEYLVSHTANSNAAAKDVTFTDLLPEGISANTVVATYASGDLVPGFTIVPGAIQDSVINAEYDLPVGEEIAIEVTGTVNVAATASNTVTNTAVIDWDTLGSDAEGNQAAEATGTDSDQASFVMASPAFAKEIVSTGISNSNNDDLNVVAGEYVTYSLTVTVPEGTTPMAQITDTLHPNLIFDTGYSVVATPDAGVSFTGNAIQPNFAGQDVIFDLGTITNTNVDNSIPDTITITYRAYADTDVARNATLFNDATLIWDADNDGDNNDLDGVLNDQTQVSVIAPRMLVEKTITQTPSEVGDVVEYTMIIRHTDSGDAPITPSDTDAYDVTFNDVLPVGVTNPSVVSAVDDSNNPVAGFTVTGGNIVSHAGLDIPLGQTITLVVQAEAGAAIVEGTSVENTAMINWSTLDDDVADGFDAGESGGSASSAVSFSLADIEKSILSTGIDDASNDNAEVVTGEYVVYQLVVDVPKGESPSAELIDVLDPGLVYDPAYGVTVVPGSSSLVSSLAPGDFSAVVASYDAASNAISIPLGDINNGTDSTSVGTLTVTYRVYVDNDTVNANPGDTLGNNAEYRWDSNGDGANIGPLDGSTSAAAPQLEVIAPELQVTKTLTSNPGDAGDTAIYEIVIEHRDTSQAGAFDASFTDTLPPEISAVSVVSALDSAGANVSGFTATGNTVTNSDFDLPLGESITLTVSGTVNTSVSASTTVLNTASIDWDTLGDDAQGNQLEEGSASDSSEDQFVVLSPSFEKTIFGTGINGGGSNNDTIEVVAGEYVAYQLVVTVPEGTTPLAQITDTLHMNLLFDSSYAITAVGSAGVSFTGTPTSPTVNGSDILFDLGTITNTNTDNTQADTVTIIYRTYTDSDVARAATLNNNATLVWDADNDGDNNDNDGELTDSTSVTVIAPELLVEKSLSVVPADSGDALEYTIVIRHANTSDAPLPASDTSAYDVTFNDVLPPGIDNPSIVSAQDSMGAPVTGFTLAGNTVSHAGFDLALNDFVTLTVSGVAGDSIVEGDTVTNTANIGWSTLDDGADDGNDQGESGGNDSDDATFSLGNIEKTIVSTGINDASNSDSEVVTGEYVTYQLAIEVPQGQTALAEIEDTLDDGLVFDQAYGVTVVPGSTNLSTSIGPGDFSNITGAYNSATNVISFPLGDITNTAVGGVVETLLLTYRVYVDNDATAAVGASLNNTAVFKWDIDGDGDNDGVIDGVTQSSAPSVEVIAPQLEILKQVVTAPVDAGDTVTYEISIAHASASQAAGFDASFSDTLPSEISNVAVVSALDSSGAPVAGFSVAGNTVSNTDFDLPLGETITLTVIGTLNTSASASTTVLNTAAVDWDTLGDSSQGNQSVEAVGFDSSSDQFVVASPDFEKRISSTGIDSVSNDDLLVVAGEYITYDLVVTVPEGTTQMAAITDTLHSDLIFDTAYVVTATGSAGVSFTGSPSLPAVNGSDVTFDLGTVTNVNSDDSVDDTVTITYRVYADADVMRNDVLDNNATLIWDADNDGDNTDNDGALSDSTVVSVISPELEVEKTVTQIPSDIGDTIEYTMLISHTASSETDAFDVSFSDALPVGLINPVIVSATDSSNTPITGFTLSGNSISHSGLDINLNDSVLLRVQAEAGASVVEGDTINNIATINWTTLNDAANDGHDAGESGGSHSDNAVFSLSNVEKRVLHTGINDASNDDTTVVTGEYVTYQVSVEVPHGKTNLAEIQDTIDPGLVFDQSAGILVTPSSSNLSTSMLPGDFTGAAALYDPATNQINMALGDISNAAPPGSVETLTLIYRVYVDNDSVNAAVGDSLGNGVEFRWDIDNDGSNNGASDGTTQASAADVEVVTSELQVSKRLLVTPQDAGDTVSYEIVIEHTSASQAAAFDASFNDTLPSEFSNVAVVSALDSAGLPVTGFVVSGNTVSHSNYDLALGDKIVLTVSASVNTSVSVSTTVTNTAEIDWDSLGDDTQGNQTVESEDSASDEVGFIVASPEFEKSVFGTGINGGGSGNDNTEVVAGEYIAYKLVVTVPEGTTPMAQITDTLHFNLLFDSSYSITAVGSAGVSFTGDPASPSVTGSDVTFDLGTITNVNTDNAQPDTITIIYRTYADSDVAAGAMLNNNAEFIWDADNDGDNNDNDGVLTDAAEVVVIKPQLVVDKEISVVPSDQGDPVEYTIVIRHSNPADAPLDVSATSAYDVTFSDTLPAGIDNPVILSSVDSTGASINGFTLTGNTISHTGFDLTYNDFVTLTISGIASATIVEGDAVSNQADITWSTLDDDSDDGFDAGESGGSISDTAVFSLSNIEKTIVSTGINDQSNDNTEVVAGEFVTYQLLVEVPQGMTPEAEVIDTLDDGLIYDQANGVSVVASSANLATSNAASNFSSVPVTYDASANTVSIALGDINNAAPIGTVETLTITYRVFVANDAVNAGLGETLNNAVDFRWDIDGDGSNFGPLDGTTEATAPEVLVIAPVLDVSKTVTTVPSDAGDAITYEITIEHAPDSQAAAFEANFIDTLPAEISDVTVLSANNSVGITVPGFTVNGNTVQNADFDLPLGESITLVVGGTVNTSASASSTVTNTASLEWQTLGDDNQGSQLHQSGGMAQASDAFTVASPEFVKTIADTGINDTTNDNTTVVAGEYVTYDLTVTVPEGTTPLVQVTDTLPDNLVFDSAFSISAAGSAGVSFTGMTTPVVNGNDVVFDLGTVTNTNADNNIPDTVTITYRTYVDSDVVPGDVLPNSATLIWDADSDGDNDDSDGVLSSTTAVTTLAPELLIDKNVSVVPGEVGDEVEYTIIIRHTDISDATAAASSTSAFDVVFSDVLPAGIVNPAIISAVDSAGVPVSGFTLTGNTVSHTGFDLAHTDTVTLIVNGVAGASLVEGDTVTNVASIEWSTLDDSSDDGHDLSEATGLDSSAAGFSLANIEKRIVSTGIDDASNDNTEVVSGEYITYELSIEVPHGITAAAEIEDTLAAGLVFDQASGVTVTPGSANLSSSAGAGDFSAATAAYDVSANTLSIDLGDISNTAPVGTVETLTVVYRVYVDRDDVQAGVGATLNNAVNFKWDINGDGTNDGSLDGSTQDSAPVVEVIAPVLQLSKQVVTVPTDAGDTVTYEIVIEHSADSQAGAFDASFTDTLPSEISGVAVSAIDSAGVPVSGFVVSGNTVSNPNYDLPLGDSITLTVSGVVNTTASASSTVVNTAAIDWQTLGNGSQGNETAENTGSASANDAFVVASPAFEKSVLSTGISDASNDDGKVVAGEYVVYRLEVLLPEGTTPLTEIVDTLHPNLVFDSTYPVTAIGSNGVSFSGPATVPAISGNTVAFDLGTVTNTNTDDNLRDTITITYRVYADSDVARGATLTNSATLVWDADNDGDINDNDGVLTDSASVSVIAPQLLVEKSVSQMPSDVGDSIQYTLVIRHSGAGDMPHPASEGDAYDITFSDSLPADLLDITIDSVTDSSGNPIAGFTVNDNTVSHSGFDLSLNDSVTLLVSATAGADIVEGDTVVNTANISWSTLNDTDNDGYDIGESGGSASDDVGFSLADVRKTIVATGINDASNDNTEVVSGEYIEYSVVVDVPHGVTPLAELVDTLDQGLVYDAGYGINVVPSSSNLTSSLASGDFSTVSSTYDATQNTVSVALGDITNIAPVGTIESLTMTYRVIVDNDLTTANVGELLNNQVDFRWDIDQDGINTGIADGTTTDSAPEVEVIAPELTMSKRVVVAPNDAGDPISYEIIIQHTGSSQAAAFDVDFVDVLPAEISNVTVASAETSTGVAVTGFIVSGNTVSHPDFDLPLGESIKITIDGVLNVSTAASTTVWNTGVVSWQTLGDPAQGDTSYESGGSDQDSDSFAVASPTFQKQLIDSGIVDSNNTAGDVVAGEYVTYNLVVTVPEGTTPAVQIVDQLGAGLAFDSAYAVSAIGSSGVTFTGNANTAGVNGNEITFDLGTITNTNTDDSVADTVTVTYRAYAENTVVSGDTLVNSALMRWDANNDGSNSTPVDGVVSDAASVAVIAPQLLVEKSVSEIPSEVGDHISYTFVIRHTGLQDAPLPVSETSAYDVGFIDALPAGLENLTVVSAEFSDGTPVNNFQITGNTLTHTGFDLPFGDEVTVVVRAEVGASTIEGETIRNDVSVNWTSLDDNADDGIDSVESSGNQTDSATFTLSEIEKTIIGTGINDSDNDDSEAVVGEFIDYQVVLEVPKGVSPHAELIDMLDVGLVFDEAQGIDVSVSSGSVSTTAAAGDFDSLNAIYNSQLNTVSVPLGDLHNTAEAGVIETITITYRVFVAGDSVNDPGDTLGNSVSFRWDIDGDGDNSGAKDGITTDTANEITVIAPELMVTKNIISHPGAINDQVTYEIHISHTGASTAGAYDVTLTDLMSDGLSDLVIDSAFDSNNLSVAGFVLDGNTLLHDGFDLPAGESVTVIVTATVTDTIAAGDSIDSTASITWSSLEASNPGDGADSISSTLEATGSEVGSDQFSIADLHKSIVSSSVDDGVNTNLHAVVGEYIDYQVVVDVPQGLTPLSEVVDTLDPGLVFDSLLGVTASSNAVTTDFGVGDFSDIAAPAHGATGAVNFALGSINNTDQNNGVVETITIHYRVYVDNVPQVQPGVMLGNGAVLRWDINGDATAEDITTASAPAISVLQPQVSASKTVDDAAPHLGQTVTYSVLVVNEPVANGADARDVSVVDVLPATALLDASTIKVNGVLLSEAVGVSDVSSGNTLALSLDNVSYDSSVLITYQATLTADTTDYGHSVDNTVAVEWSTLADSDNADGVDAIERDVDDGLSTSAGNLLTLTAPDYQIEKSSSPNGVLRAGDTVSYSIKVSNAGSHEGTGIVVRDYFPVATLAAPLNISDGGVFDQVTGVITWEIPSLLVNESVELTVQAKVQSPQSANTDNDETTASDLFINRVEVTDDGNHGDDPDLSNNQAEQSNSVDAAPDYRVTKTNSVEMAAPTQQLGYVIHAENNGLQNGENVVIVDTFPSAILSVVDAQGGAVDQQAGTITWHLAALNVGQSETFNVLFEVLPTASLDTADQMFSNSVSITDDGANGVDPTPDNNEASESDMLLAGAGEPQMLAAVPESIGATPIASGTTTILIRDGETHGKDLPGSSADSYSSTSRILTSEILFGRDQDDNKKPRIGENDLLNGGYLLDTFTVASPEVHCAPDYVSYEYESDPNLELLDWLQEQSGSQADIGVDPEAAAPEEAGPQDTSAQDGRIDEGPSVSDVPEVTDGMRNIEPDEHGDSAPRVIEFKTLQQQIEQESENFHNGGREELLAAFKESA